MNTKVCKDCGEEFPLDNFRILRQGVTKTIYDPYCKPCGKRRRRISDRRYKQTEKYRRTLDPEYQTQPVNLPSQERVRNRQLLRDYGITNEDYNTMLEEQGGVCKICGSPPNGRQLAVDHCHIEGHVRGLLCHSCNTGLGLFKDNVELLKNAIKYLNT